MDWISRSPHADSLRRGAKVAPIFWSSASPMARRAAAFPPVAARPCAALKADTAASKSAEAVPSMGPVKCPRSRRANFCSGIPAPSVSCSAKRSYQKPSSCRSSAFIEPARARLKSLFEASAPTRSVCPKMAIFRSGSCASNSRTRRTSSSASGRMKLLLVSKRAPATPTCGGRLSGKSRLSISRCAGKVWMTKWCQWSSALVKVWFAATKLESSACGSRSCTPGPPASEGTSSGVRPTASMSGSCCSSTSLRSCRSPAPPTSPAKLRGRARSACSARETCASLAASRKSSVSDPLITRSRPPSISTSSDWKKPPGTVSSSVWSAPSSSTKRSWAGSRPPEQIFSRGVRDRNSPWRSVRNAPADSGSSARMSKRPSVPRASPQVTSTCASNGSSPEAVTSTSWTSGQLAPPRSPRSPCQKRSFLPESSVPPLLESGSSAVSRPERTFALVPWPSYTSIDTSSDSSGRFPARRSLPTTDASSGRATRVGTCRPPGARKSKSRPRRKRRPRAAGGGDFFGTTIRYCFPVRSEAGPPPYCTRIGKRPPDRLQTLVILSRCASFVLSRCAARPDPLSSGPQRGRALEQQLPLAPVARERCGPLDLGPRLLEAAELGQQITAHARQQVIAPQRRLRSERVHQLEARRRTGRHRDRDCAVQLDDGRRRDLEQLLVEPRDTGPVGLPGGGRPRVTSGDRGLQRVRAGLAAQLAGTLERGEAAADEQAIPAGAILIEEQHGLARRAGAGPRAGRLELHQRDQPVDLRLLRQEARQDAAKAERVLAEIRPHPVFAGRGGVTLVEDEVDDLQHRREASGALLSARDLEHNAFLRQRPLGPDDPLGDGGFRHQEGARDLLGRQASQEAERQRDSRLGGEDRVARDEDQAQEVVADVVVDRGLEVRRGELLPDLHLAPQLLVLVLQPLAPPQQVDGLVLGGRHEPGARVVRYARLGPHFSSAVTSASCASSSARPTSSMALGARL